jgi:hypothetical protein
LPFLAYDAAGGYHRADEKGQPIDTSSTAQSTDFDGPITSATDLSGHIANSSLARTCMVDKFLSLSVRSSIDTSSCEVVRLSDDFAKNGRQILPLLSSIALSGTFRFRTP